ncbi:MAG TPA: CCA tRNA nucleotidyltransferase [Candidatus Paceibacterota bacterium]|nr:CCA tRNA nucleotidyltransferase [Candidatus Paceibacterota bacterium]
MKHRVPREILETHARLRTAGFEAYLVGGCVRDLLLDKEPKDWDITTNATPESIQPLFEETFYENEYGTVGVVTQSENPRLKVIEITPYRVEGAYSNVRHPDHVEWSTNLSDDLRRRDFTINALAYDPESGTLIDEHGGQEDLKRKRIATVGEPKDRFAEDALRMLRAVRLAAELDFTIESATAAGIAQNADKLVQISRERVRDEFTKILESDRPMQALFVAQKLDILKYIIPELEQGIGCAQNQAHSFDVFEHLLRSLQHAADKKWPLEVRLATLLHDIGKPASRRWSDDKKDWTFYGHDVIGARMTKKILSDLRFPKETIQKVEALVRWHMFFSDPDTITLSAVRRLIARVGPDNIDDLVNLRVCDRIGTGRPKAHPFRLRKYMSMIEEALRDPISVSMLKINGSTIMGLGEKPGPRIGWVLHALLEEVLDEPGKNTEEYLTDRAKALLALSDADLRELGEGGKNRREAEEKAAIQELREKHHVT